MDNIKAKGGNTQGTGKPFKYSLEENILALLGFFDKEGQVAADVVASDLFEGDYKTMAERCIDYHKRYGKAPGRAHIKDVVADIIDDPDNKAGHTFTRMIDQMRSLSEEVNSQFVLDKMNTFVQLQTFKKTTIEVAEKLQSGQESAIPAVMELWQEQLRSSAYADFDAGTSLADTHLLFYQEDDEQESFSIGIDALDRVGFQPTRKKLMVLLGPTGHGKSWGLIHIGRQALLQRKRVLHITLEMSEKDVLGRYHQTLFAIPKKSTDRPVIAVFDKDEHGNLIKSTREVYEPDFALDSGDAELEVDTRLRALGVLPNRLIIKRFPAKNTPVSTIRNYIQNLQRRKGFIPDVVLVDYLGLIEAKEKGELRTQLGAIAVDLRNLAIDLNIAVVTAHQTNRTGAQSKTAKSEHISESFEIKYHCEFMGTLTRNDENVRRCETQFVVDKNRDDEDKFTVRLSTCFHIGQFAIDSCRIKGNGSAPGQFDESSPEIHISDDEKEAIISALNDKPDDKKFCGWRADERAAHYAGKAIADALGWV